MARETTHPAVTHNELLRRYEIDVDGEVSVLTYALENHQMLILHTFVPPHLRGRGLAEQLVRAALHDAQERGLRVMPACSYVATFIERHPEFRAVLSA